MKFLRLISCPLLVLALGGKTIWAAEYTPVASVGYLSHTGLPDVSIAGAKTYLISLASEKRKGFFRPKSQAELQYGSGDFEFEDTEYPFTLMGADFQFGFNIFVFPDGQLQPYFGASGSLGARSMSMTVPSDSSLTGQSLGLAFGYEIAAGCDIRFGSADGPALRIEGSYSSKGSPLAGQSLRLDGFKFTLGKSF